MTENKYDWKDRVERGAVLIAGPLKMATYRVRDPETDQWSPQQFHATYDNHVLAVMSEESAKLFARFINSALSEPPVKIEGMPAMEVPMETILTAIDQNIDVLPELVEQAIREGFAERVEYVVLTADGMELLERK